MRMRYNEELPEIHKMVESVKRDPGVAGMRIQLADDAVGLTEEIIRLRKQPDPGSSKTQRQWKAHKEADTDICKTITLSAFVPNLLKIHKQISLASIWQYLKWAVLAGR